jgi:DNA-binding transcriptional MerR regulator
MSNTPEENNEDYLSLRQLHKTLAEDYGVKISLSTLHEYVKKGLVKPDYSTNNGFFFLKTRAPGIADWIKAQKLSSSSLEQQPQPPPQQQPIIVPQVPQQSPPDITTMSLTEEILIRLQALEKQVKDQQEENHKLKMQLADLEETVKKHYEEYCKDYNELYDAIKKFGEIGDKINQQNRENFENIEHEINQIRAVLNRFIIGDHNL